MHSFKSFFNLFLKSYVVYPYQIYFPKVTLNLSFYKLLNSLGERQAIEIVENEWPRLNFVLPIPVYHFGKDQYQ